MEFPSEWDELNPYTWKLYNRCRALYKENEEKKFIDVFHPSAFFNYFCTVVLVYTFISFVVIILKRKAYEKLNFSVKLSLLFTFGTMINILNSFFRRYKYFDYPCFLVPYLNGIAFPLNFVPSAGQILLVLKQCYTNSTLYSTYQNKDSNKFKERGYLTKICLVITETKLIRITFIYIIISLHYVVFTSALNIDYTMNPLSLGFCSSDVEQLLNYFLIFVYLIIFSPMAIHDIFMFNNAFLIGKKLIFGLTSLFICILAYTIFYYMPIYRCSKISKYLPIDFYMIAFFSVFNITFISMPILKSNKVHKRIQGLELTKNGLLKLFDDEVLYKDFFEYAVSKRCVEFVVFIIEYREFKSIYQVNKSFIEEIKTSGLLSPGDSPVEAKDKKALFIFIQIHRKANEIYGKYLVDNSELQLNLPMRVVDKVYRRLYSFHTYFEENYINGEQGKPLEMDTLDIENVFDEVHREAVDSLFLNVYPSFVIKQKSS